MWSLRDEGRAPGLLILTLLRPLHWEGGHGGCGGKLWSTAWGANIQGSWNAPPSQGASWDACSGNVASRMVLSAFPGQEQILPWQVRLQGLPEVFSFFLFFSPAYLMIQEGPGMGRAWGEGWR